MRASWEAYLDPDEVKPQLLAAATFIAAQESLKTIVVGRVRDFFTNHWDQVGGHVGEEYKAAVLRRNPSPTYASLDWLAEMGAVDADDRDAFRRVTDCRNKLVHELLGSLGANGLPAEFEACLADLLRLLRKIEVWWILNVEVSINPEFDGQDISEEDVQPGSVLMLQVLLEVAVSEGEGGRAYLEAFRRLHPSRPDE